MPAAPFSSALRGEVPVQSAMLAAMLFGMLGGHSAVRSLCAAAVLVVVAAVVACSSRRRGAVQWGHLADLAAMTALLVLSLGMAARGTPALPDAAAHPHSTASLDPMLLQLLAVAAWLVVRGLQLAPKGRRRPRLPALVSATVTALMLVLMLALH